MKITNIRVTPVNIPLEALLCWAGGLYPGTAKAIIEVETDEGLVGLGSLDHLVKSVSVSRCGDPQGARREDRPNIDFRARVSCKRWRTERERNRLSVPRP